MSRNDQLKAALQKAREHVGTGSFFPRSGRPLDLMSEDGYYPRQQYNDLPALNEDWRDNPPE